MSDLSGLHAVITGGNGGIGLAVATGMARAGANITLWARDAAKGEAAVAHLGGLGVKAQALTCDVADEEQVVDAMARSVEALGPLGCVVANAGTAAASPFVDTSLADWRGVMATNLDGVFLTCREGARRFVEQGDGGSMILVSSMVSRFGAAQQAAYAASKTGVLGLARTLAVELARHRVRVNTLVPGWTRTGLTVPRQEDERFMAATTARTPVRRWADPEEFEEVGAFLADPSQTFHTGNEVVVDGGYSVF
ncbi:SDR family oxidoreductase [Pseudonocardia sp. NPDC049154]|uniref:SDR family NAD(P)-dependent oxidoreductase n=1 Tax=Pseudonocardia sp. NPDC049154 TaxID=3155501 RepID=UPI0033EC30C9